jgi:hypothetical protein
VLPPAAPTRDECDQHDEDCETADGLHSVRPGVRRAVARRADGCVEDEKGSAQDTRRARRRGFRTSRNLTRRSGAGFRAGSRVVAFSRLREIQTGKPESEIVPAPGHPYVAFLGVLFKHLNLCPAGRCCLTETSMTRSCINPRVSSSLLEIGSTCALAAFFRSEFAALRR